MSLANEKVGHLNFMAPLEKSPIEHQHETSADEVGDVISDLVSTAKQEVERVLSMRRQLVSSQQTDNRVANSTGPTPTYRKNGEAETATVSFPPELTPIRRIATLHPLQEWEGRVVEIRDNDIVAMLTDITARYTHEHVEATIPISEISDRDAEHMVVGGVFRWVIGIEHSVEGTVSRVSRIVFRDLPRMTHEDFRRGREWAQSAMAAWNT